MPADSPHINLCKTIMSAVALGYPPPTLLNWNGEYNRPEWHLAGSHIAKLESLLAVIEHLLEQSDGGDEHDLAMLVDAYDVWFQLPPSVLIERYHRLNREADERVRRQWQAASGFATDFPVASPRQSIVVTSAKDCHPSRDSGSDPHYAHWPESPMPPSLYGADTDKILPRSSDPARKYRKMRPRCVNSGLIMGPMGAMRDALRRCKSKIDRAVRSGRQLWSDQALFGEVIGDQEMWREWMRELGASWDGTASERNPSGLNSEVRTIADAVLIKQERFEFGIGLDYGFELIPPTCSSEEDGFFVRFDDEVALVEHTTHAGVPDGVRVRDVPPELERMDADQVLSGVAWGEVPLYTDFFFGNMPVGIHHNAYVDNLKPWRLANWWNMTWFHPQLRSLVLSGLRPSAWQRPLARLAPPTSPRGAGGVEGRELVYWAPRDGDMSASRRVQVFEPSSTGGSFVPIEWDGVCQKGPKPWHEELFGDGKGRLEL